MRPAAAVDSPSDHAEQPIIRKGIAMTLTKIPLLRSLVPLALVAMLGACSAMDARQEVLTDSARLQKGPEMAPARSITNFSDGLRCMDNLLLDYGVRDVSVITEDIVDETKKVNAGTKDMLISAVSDMTRRSHGVRLIAYGKDTGNTIGYLFQAQDRNMYAAIPSFAIKGSVSQFDESLSKKNVDGGIGIEPFLSVGAAKTSSSNVLGLDLAVLSTADLAVVPGVSSRNQVLILKDGKGVDGEATIKKFGINYSMTVSRTEGQAQALRTLVELASIELVGRLTKIPYWSCLGAGPGDEAVRNEINDWYESLRANPAELLGWTAVQMRQRGLYDGPVQGEIDAASMKKLQTAVLTYSAALGLSPEPKIGPEFFAAYMQANHRDVMAKMPPATPPQAVASAPAQPTPLALTVTSADGGTAFPAGDVVNLLVKPARDAHVYCYLRDESSKVQRFYPNRFARDSLVRAETALKLPGSSRFQLVAAKKGRSETVACFATERDVLASMSPAVAGTDLANLDVSSLDEVRDAFMRASDGRAAQAYFRVQGK